MSGHSGLGRRIPAALERFSAELVACSFAVFWFFFLGYGPTLRPTHIAWMLRDDWAAYLWGFAFFRNADWLWPLGNTPDLFWPYGTSVGFTDANPWASLLFKLLSPLLPADFQFSGMWFLTCFVLLAFFGTRIGRVFTEDKVRQALSGALFATTPLMPSRHAHIALCAFFFVAAGVYLNLKHVFSKRDARRLVGVACLLLAWAAGTHGYLSVMLLALCLSACVRLWVVQRLFRPHEAFLAALACLGVTTLVYWMFGYLGWKPADLTAEGFGQFSGDLTALVNSQGWSRWVPGLPHTPRQWEGFSYLGLGVLLLLVLRVALSVRSPSAAGKALGAHWPLAFALFAMLVYSWSDHVAYLGETVLDLTGLYQHATQLTGIFRSSGRFSWPLNLTLVALGVSAAASLKKQWLGRFVLLIALLVQAGELDRGRLNFADVALDPLVHPAWAQSADDYLHLSLVPLHLLWVCRYDHRLVNRLSYEAYRRRWTFNSGNFMRKEPGVASLCNESLRSPNQETVYVVDLPRLAEFRRWGFQCGALDRLFVCVSPENPTPLLSALREHPM